MSSNEPMDQTLRIVLIVAAVLVLAPVMLMIFAFPMMGLGAGMWGGGMMGGGMMGPYGGYGVSPIMGIVWPLVWLVILVGGGYLAYKWLTGGARGDPALRELRLAYAQGDISDEEFEERRSRLERE